MTSGGFGTRRPYPDQARLFFLILKLISFKKLNRAGRDRDEKIPRPVPFTFDFYFYFLFFIFYICFFIFIILKLIYFIKNKNIMNFYKLFIKKILIFIFIYIKV